MWLRASGEESGGAEAAWGQINNLTTPFGNFGCSMKFVKGMWWEMVKNVNSKLFLKTCMLTVVYLVINLKC